MSEPSPNDTRHLPHTTGEPLRRTLAPCLRILDAAANRAAEGLRVIEDYLRFALDDAQLTAAAKQLRHRLATALRPLAWGERLAARNTTGDVGTAISLPSESLRLDAADVVAASFQRVQQALRSLEEFGKTVDPAIGARIESIRYASYSLQKQTESGRQGRERLAGARLYVLVDGRESVEAFEQLVEQLLSGGVDVIQLRDKRLSDRELIERGKILGRCTRAAGKLWIMNDRADLARAAGADGVHLGQDDLTVREAQGILGAQALIGVSTHSIEQARRAVEAGAHYIGVGPTFPSTTKTFAAFTGLELLSAISREIGLPSFAIGGIDVANLPQVLATGIHRIAVSGAVIAATNPSATATTLAKMLGAL